MTLPAYAMGQASFPEMYERLLVGPLFRPWAELTLDAVALSPGDRALDIACGTGIVARVAKERLGETLGFAERGYRLAINCGPEGGQHVYHLHLHFLAGRLQERRVERR